MSGVDAVRGFNYQHCHALLAALDVATDPTTLAIRVEGIDDVLDLEFHAAKPGGGTTISRGLQAKSRMQPYTWTRSELLGTIRRWIALPSSSSSEFALVTDGFLGPSGRVVVDALDAARAGDPTLLAEFLNVAVTDPLCAVAARATVVSEPGSVEALFQTAEREVRAGLPSGPNHPDAERESEERVNALFRLISTRSGMSEPDDRLITREEILEVLGGSGTLRTEDRWAGELSAEYLRTASNQDFSGIVTPVLNTPSTDDGVRLADLSAISGPILLTGRTGSGKSTACELWRATAASTNERVVVCYAETYVAQRLSRVVADAVGDAVGRELPRIVGQQVLGDASTTLVIDGVSEIPAQFRLELAKELRSHLAQGHGARIALVGRDEGVCASTLPATTASSRLYPRSFDHEARIALTAKVLAEATDLAVGDRGTGAAGEPETEFEHACRVALAQVEHALDDAAGNPMLLRLALELVAGGTEFTDRPSVYALTLDRMAARTNVADIRLASAALGIVFARLLDDGRRYANPLEWSRLFNDASAELERLGVATDADEVQAAIDRSGLVTAVFTGLGPTRVQVPVHDSFADYFAARAHADHLVALPESLTENDENRILMSAQMSMLSDEDCLAVASMLPFSLVRLSDSEDTPPGYDAPERVAALLAAVLPEVDNIHVTMWRSSSRTLAQIGTPQTGWVEEADAPSLFNGPTAISEPGYGPVSLTVRLWRLILIQRLKSGPYLRPQPPASQLEGAEQLKAHVLAAQVESERLISQIASPIAAARLSAAVGPTGMTGVVYERTVDHPYRDGWPVRYSRTVDTQIGLAAVGESPEPVSEDGYMQSGDLESLTDESPSKTSAKRITESINKLTRGHWLAS